MGKRKASGDISSGRGASSLKIKISDKGHESMVVTFPSGYTPGSAKESILAMEGAGPGGGEPASTTAVIVDGQAGGLRRDGECGRSVQRVRQGRAVPVSLIDVIVVVTIKS